MDLFHVAQPPRRGVALDGRDQLGVPAACPTTKARRRTI